MTSSNSAFKINFSTDIEYLKHSIVSKKIVANTGGNVSLFAFDKGEALSEHTAPFDALVQIVDGRASIIIDGKSHHLTDGESIVMPANIPHALKAEDRFKMLLTMIKG